MAVLKPPRGTNRLHEPCDPRVASVQILCDVVKPSQPSATLAHMGPMRSTILAVALVSVHASALVLRSDKAAEHHEAGVAHHLERSLDSASAEYRIRRWRSTLRARRRRTIGGGSWTSRRACSSRATSPSRSRTRPPFSIRSAVSSPITCSGTTTSIFRMTTTLRITRCCGSPTTNVEQSSGSSHFSRAARRGIVHRDRGCACSPRAAADRRPVGEAWAHARRLARSRDRQRGLGPRYRHP